MKAIITFDEDVSIDTHAMLESYLVEHLTGRHTTTATTTTTIEVEFEETTENSDMILRSVAHIGNIFGIGPSIRFH